MNTAEQTFNPGEALTLTTVENGFPARRGVEFVGISGGGNSAQVKFGLETFVVPLDQLSRQTPPQPPPWLPKWYEPPKPPIAPSELELETKLRERRAALAKAHDRAKAAQDKVTAARETSQRADRALIDARSTLATLDAHDRDDQRVLEVAIQLGRPLPVRSNGPDRSYITDRVAAAEKAQTRFDRELAEATAARSDSLTSVRKCATDVVAVLLERETENLRAAEQRAALFRAELTAVSGWWPSAEIGVLRISPATAACIEAPLVWSDQPNVRSGGGWLKPWQQVFDRLWPGRNQRRFHAGGLDAVEQRRALVA